MSHARSQTGWIAAASAVVLTAILLLPAVYMGAYFVSIEGDSANGPLMSPPGYRLGGEQAEALYGAAHYIDREYLRPGVWFEIEDFDLSFRQDSFAPTVPAVGADDSLSER